MANIDLKNVLIKDFEKLGVEVTDKDLIPFFRSVREKHISKGEAFLSEGDTSCRFGIVLEGLFYYGLQDLKGKEVILGFKEESNILVPYDSFFNQTPSLFHITALEDSTILEGDMNNFRELSYSNPTWMKLALSIYESNFLTKANRELQFLTMDIKQRYLRFVDDFPSLVKRIPRYRLAQYLGVSPESLSRALKES